MEGASSSFVKEVVGVAWKQLRQQSLLLAYLLVVDMDCVSVVDESTLLNVSETLVVPCHAPSKSEQHRWFP